MGTYQLRAGKKKSFALQAEECVELLDAGEQRQRRLDGLRKVDGTERGFVNCRGTLSTYELKAKSLPILNS